ncbi:hypothetical protein F66182_7110 [Fusarium sp. NRRL 66182]|nr:hypothetical protein F66182_7110 [Fusarium sp. NRRL 66182]
MSNNFQSIRLNKPITHAAFEKNAISRKHHCGGCRKALTTRCLKKGHEVLCKVHGLPHLPGHACVKCSNEAERAAEQQVAVDNGTKQGQKNK